ncbi:hypothetical protein [Streptomyces sp. NPDC052015]|uniref:hypothetical protein n=1 Tax=Streptomyces sp. NPDC052015 TaxID=3154755 RepID=UPI00342EDF01
MTTTRVGAAEWLLREMVRPGQDAEGAGLGSGAALRTWSGRGPHARWRPRSPLRVESTTTPPRISGS